MNPSRRLCLFGGLLLLAAFAAPALAGSDIGIVRFFSTPGGALIYIDEAYRGVTSAGLGQSPPIDVAANAQHTVRLVKQGYQDFATTFTVNTGQFRDITGTLLPAVPTTAFGRIALHSSPGGAMVYIDGTYYGLTPTEGESSLSQDVFVGRHRVTMQLNGYSTYSTTVQAESGQRIEIQATLVAVTPGGAIQVSTAPGAATVTLDGKDPRAASATYVNVSPGMHMVVATLEGYEPLSRSVQVYSGQTAQVLLTLTPLSSSVGAVHVESVPPGADVYVDGAYLGSTSITIGNLAPGSHAVLLRRSGYQEHSVTVTIAPGSTVELPVNLRAQPLSTGSVEVVSYPAGAAIYLDGAFCGQTKPWDAVDVPGVVPGDHDLTLSLEGYYDYVSTVTVTAGRGTSIAATLKDLPGANPHGQVAVASGPSGAGVYLDIVFRGYTPLTAAAVPTGAHTLLLRAPGYQDWATAVQVSEGETAQVSAGLVRAETQTATATLTVEATAPNRTPTTAATTRSGSADGFALTMITLVGLAVLRARQ